MDISQFEIRKGRNPMNRFNTLLVLCLCLTGQSLVYGDAIRQPPSLDAGEQYRLAFVTSTKTTAESSDIDTYNAFVQSTADAAPIGEWGLNWKAIASTEAVNARDNTNTKTTDVSTPIFLLDGSELAPSYFRFWGGGDQVNSKFDIDEFGAKYDADALDVPLFVWTGTIFDGTTHFDDAGVNGPLGFGATSVSGAGDLLSYGWFGAGSMSPNELLQPMYAISEKLTAVPEPASLPITVLLALLVLMRQRGIRSTVEI